MKEAGRSLLYFLLIVASCFGVHKLLAALLDWGEPTAPLQLMTTYLLFSSGSVVVLTVVHVVYSRNKDVVGFSFLAVTMVKFIAAGIVGRPLWSGDNGSRLTQLNFIAIFLLFLAIETILTIRILNKKQ